METARSVRPLRLRARHYHLSDTTIGGPSGYRDDVFPTRREALAAARERAQWLAALTGLKVQALADPGRYLLTTGRVYDAGRIIELDECDDPDCLEGAGETGFPPGPLSQSDAWESLGTNNPDGRSKSGLPRHARI